MVVFELASLCFWVSPFSSLVRTLLRPQTRHTRLHVHKIDVEGFYVFYWCRDQVCVVSIDGYVFRRLVDDFPVVSVTEFCLGLRRLSSLSGFCLFKSSQFLCTLFIYDLFTFFFFFPSYRTIICYFIVRFTLFTL